MIRNPQLTSTQWIALIRESDACHDPLDLHHISYCDAHNVFALEYLPVDINEHTDVTVALLRLDPDEDEDGVRRTRPTYAIAVQIVEHGLGPDAPCSLTGLFRLPVSPGAVPELFGVDATPIENTCTLPEFEEELQRYPAAVAQFDSLATWCWTHNLYTSDKL